MKGWRTMTTEAWDILEKRLSGAPPPPAPAVRGARTGGRAIAGPDAARTGTVRFADSTAKFGLRRLSLRLIPARAATKGSLLSWRQLPIRPSAARASYSAESRRRAEIINTQKDREGTLPKLGRGQAATEGIC